MSGREARLTGNPHDLLTDRQKASLDEAVAEARLHGVEISNRYLFDIAPRGESRPGRGHDIMAYFLDGEHAVTVSVDVYGNGDGPVISTTDLVCNPMDDGSTDGCDICPGDDEDDTTAAMKQGAGQ